MIKQRIMLTEIPEVEEVSEAFVIFYGGILDILVLNFGILSQNIHHCR